MITYTFGALFQYNDSKFIYLAETLKEVYVAKIIDDNITKQLEKIYLNKLKRGRTDIDHGMQFCFIKLTCEDFKDQGALYGHQPISLVYRRFFIPILSENISNDDLKTLKKEILDKPSWGELKERVKGIKI